MNDADAFANHSSTEGHSALRVTKRLVQAHDREALHREVWSKPISDVAQDYGVPNSTISRRCKQLHIPTPSPGHWQRLASGLPVQQQPPLPLVEIVSKEQNEWHSSAYTSEEIIKISTMISADVSTGLSLQEACWRAGIPISTYRRWRKRSTRFGEAFGKVEYLPSNRKPTRKPGARRTVEEKRALVRGVDDARRGGEKLHVALRKLGVSVNSYHRWRAQLAK